MDLTQENFDLIVDRLNSGKLLIATHGNQNSAELRTTFNITGSGVPYKFYTLFTVEVSDIEAGDKFNVFAEVEVTQVYAWNVMFHAALLFAPDSAPPVDAAALAAATEVSEGNGFNFKGDLEHHMARVKVGTWAADQAYAGAWNFNFVVWAASSDASVPPAAANNMKVEIDYGRMWVDQFR